MKIYPSDRHAELQQACDRLRDLPVERRSLRSVGLLTRWGRWLERTWIEQRLREVADVLESLAIFQILLLLSRLALLLAVFNWFNGSDARLAQKHREAWQVINSALVTPFQPGQSTGEGGRLAAIETLYRGNQSLSGLYAPGAYLTKLDLSRNLCVPSELRKFNFNVLFDPRAYLPYSHTNYNPRWEWHWPIASVLPWKTRCMLTRGKFSALAIGANLQEANLTAADLANVALMNANLAGTRLADANLNDADLGLANLAGANLSHASLRFGLLVGTRLPKVKLDRADLTGSLLNKADLTGANLQDATLDRAKLDRADLTGADLWRTSLRGASLEGTVLQDAQLIGSDLTRAIGLTATQLLSGRPPFVCHARLPNGIEIDPDRDCERFVRYRIEQFGESEDVARDRVESADRDPAKSTSSQAISQTPAKKTAQYPTL